MVLFLVLLEIMEDKETTKKMLHIEEELRQLSEENASLKRKIKRLENETKSRQEKINQLEFSIQQSKALKVARTAKQLHPKRVSRSLTVLTKKSLITIKTQGPKEFVKKAIRFVQLRAFNKSRGHDYEIWVKNHTHTEADYSRMKEEVKEFSYQPKISVVIPVYNVDEEWLRKAIDSVKAQVYENWELCIVDDCSPKPHVKEVLKAYENENTDGKMKFYYSPENLHISLSSNKGLEMSTGEFVTFLDHDDEIPREALFEVVKLLNENRDLDFIYSDEDLMTLDGDRVNPIFKPDWSPETALSMMYTTHLGVYRTELAKEVGGYRKGFEGSQDFDFVLRFTEKIEANRIAHIPQVLYHWRMIPGSTAMSYSEKSYARDAARKAVAEAIERRNIKGHVEDGLTLYSFRVKREIEGNPKVAIIIPAHNRADLVKVCIESIEQKTTYTNYEIVLVDNNSDDPESLKYFEEVGRKHTLLRYPHPFNYSAINNFAVRHTESDYILFLNNDTEVINDDWLESMLELAQLPEIGAVGAKLIYPNEKIQHAGIILGLGGYAAHSHRFFNADEHGYMGRISIISNVSAVTGACLLVRRSYFDEVGGFNEQDLGVAYNDVDLCIKLMDKGCRNVYTPFAELYHYESVSRGQEDTEEKIIRFEKEKKYLYETWKKYIDNDPYYNPNLTRDREDFGINIHK